MRKFLTRRNIIIAIVLVLLFGWWWQRSKSKSKSGQEVKLATVQKGEVVDSITISGEIKALNQATLNFPAPGKLSYIGIKDGDTVKKGQYLASLDLGDLQAAETRAHYTYLAADANAKLVEDQVKDHDGDETFAQKNSRVAAQTARDMAYDAWLTAQRAVRNARLFTPFAGVVTNVTISAVGDTVGVTDGVTVVDPASLYFSAEVDESDVGKVTMGMKVRVVLDAYNIQKFEGAIEEISFASQTSSTGATVFPVRIRFESEMLPKLRLGMNGDAQIILDTRENVLKLPVEAVLDGQVILPGKEEKKVKVETGLSGETDVEIKSGLNEGDQVVIK